MQPSKAQDPVAAPHPDRDILAALTSADDDIDGKIGKLDEHEKFAINTRAVKCLYAW